MKQPHLSFVQAFIVAVGVLSLSSCNGGKLDPDLIDSITGKVSVEKITIDQEDFEMMEGESTVLTATVLPDDATDKTVSWNSSKEDVVMISNTGKAMAMAPGKSVITAKAGSKTDFITITVIAKEDPVSPPDPSGNFIGSYALDDGSGLTDTYFSFFKGTLSKYSLKQSGTKVVIAENSLWNTSVDDFSMDDTGEYAIENGTMYLKCVPYGTVSFSGNKMTLAGKTYTKFSGFKEERYSSLSVKENVQTQYDYQAHSVTIPVNIIRPIPAGTLSASTKDTWMKDIKIENGVVTFEMEENNSGEERTGSVLMHYLGADDLELYFTQSYVDSEISLSADSQQVGYEGGSFSFDFEVTNPRESVSVTAQSQASWITDVVVDGNKVRYKVAENNSGASRSGKIRLTYGNFATTDFTITQSWSASEITVTPESQSVTYTGGSFSFDFEVTNPREGASVTAQSQVSWITDVVVDGNKVSFKIEDNSYFSKRTGTIFISYGCANGIVYDSKRFTVLQEYEIDPTSANCYVISTPGTRQIKAVYGNSRVLINNIASVEVLWESFGTATAPLKGDIIQSVSYAAGRGSSAGTITFSTPSTLRNGNAVIAAKDASGNILWSWHIWVCKDYDPAVTGQAYYNNAGVMMDRNLGATSATPGDVGALGLLYQWGRKDPFLGSSSISSGAKAASTLSWPSTVSSSSSNGTIAYATAHPTTFIACNFSNNDWYYTGSSSTDNTRWQSSKTIYDPCPPGWRVPDGGPNGVWSKAVGSSSYFTGYPYDSTKMGMNFSGKFGSASTIWYPASGGLDRDDGSSLDSVGYGYWWSCTPNVILAYYLYLSIDGDVSPSGNSSYRAYGQSVRCLQE